MNKELPKDIGGYQHIEDGITQEGDIWVCNGVIDGFVDYKTWPYAFTAQQAFPNWHIYRKMAQPGHHQPEVVEILKNHGLVPTGNLSDSISSPVLSQDASTRKRIPIATGFIDYFPRAIAAVAHVSQIGNDQHNPGSPLHWDRSKSGDESDALMRHFVERGTIDIKDGCRHSAKVAWRAMALLEKELERAEKKPLDGHEICS